jgi:hypothetical protein
MRRHHTENLKSCVTFYVWQNFYLIDPYLVGFVMTILGRRLVYCALSRVLLSWSPVSLRPILQQLLRWHEFDGLF